MRKISEVKFQNNLFSSPAAQTLILATGVGILVFLLSVIGIVTRPSGLLASFWPANPIFLGLLLRFPSLRNPSTWLMAALGFLLSDLLFDPLRDAFVLSLANLISVTIGYLLLIRLPEEDLALLRPESIIYLFVGCIVSAGLVASFCCWINLWLFGGELWQGWKNWFSSELMNNLAFLPLLLSWPRGRWHIEEFFIRSNNKQNIFFSLAALVLSVILSIVIGGPGIVAFPLPALLWCALNMNVFTMSIINMLVSAVLLVSLGLQWIDPASVGSYETIMLSFRFGITLMTMGPIAVASNTVANHKQLNRLYYTATRDTLTGALLRAEFIEQANRILQKLSAEQRSVAIMMCDLDHFKRVNDTYGHAKGDEVLVDFARTVRSGLRETDLFGRLGGEEFVILLPGVSEPNSLIVAERIRSNFERYWLSDANSEPELKVTTSIGLFYADRVDAPLQDMLFAADCALYQAKSSGRNRIVASTTLQSPGMLLAQSDQTSLSRLPSS